MKSTPASGLSTESVKAEITGALSALGPANLFRVLSYIAYLLLDIRELLIALEEHADSAEESAARQLRTMKQGRRHER